MGKNSTEKKTATSDKSLILSLCALAAAVISYFGSPAVSIGDLADCGSACLITIAASLIIYQSMKKHGINRKNCREIARSSDPRILGSLQDLSDLGSLFSALTFVAVLISRLYISYDAVFSGIATGSTDSIFGLLYSAALSMSLSSAIYCVTSLKTSEQIICRAATVSDDSTGSDIKRLKMNAQKISSAKRLMAGISRGAALRMTLVLSLSLVCIISAATGVVIPFGVSSAAAVCSGTVILSVFCMADNRTDENTHTEEKLHLWTPALKNIVIVNTAAYLVMSIFMLFSFPARSVFTDYDYGTNVYEYYDDYEPVETIPAFSVPLHDDDHLKLYTAFTIFTAAYMLITAVAACAESADISNVFSKSRSLTLGIALMCLIIMAASALSFFIDSRLALDAVRITVMLMTVSVILLADIIRGAFVFRNKKEAKASE